MRNFMILKAIAAKDQRMTVPSEEVIGRVGLEPLPLELLVVKLRSWTLKGVEQQQFQISILRENSVEFNVKSLSNYVLK